MTTPLYPTYARYDIAFERGEGPYLFDIDGRRYLDFATGIAVNALGHGHPRMVDALKSQADNLWHVSNLYRIPEQETRRGQTDGEHIRRRGVLLQFWGRSRGNRSQDRPQISARGRQSATLAHHHG